MKTDLYTKIVLTIIAAALVALVCRDYAAPMQAQGIGPTDVNIVAIKGYRFGALDVSRLEVALPVKVVQ